MRSRMDADAASNGRFNERHHDLTAVADRLGIKLSLGELDRMSAEKPVLVDLKPSGKYYLEDFHHAGGVPAVL